MFCKVLEASNYEIFVFYRKQNATVAPTMEQRPNHDKEQSEFRNWVTPAQHL